MQETSVSQPPRIDPVELRAMVSSLERLIAEASRTVTELKAAIASAEGHPDSNRRDRHAEKPIPAQPTTAPDPEIVPEQRIAVGRKPGPTPWSRRPAATPWSKRRSVPPVPAPGAPARVSAPPSPGIAPTTEHSSPALPRTAPRPPESEVARQQTDINTGSEITRIVGELATRHGLEVIGFDAGGIDVHAVREIASALDDLLAKYPIPLCGIEITERRDGASSRPMRDRPSEAGRSDAPALWIVLDGAALTNLVPPGGVTRETRRRGRRRGATEQSVYTAIVREFAGALDIAGGFRARQEAWRTLIDASLRSGGRVDHGPLEPGQALVEAFTEVVLRGDRAGKLAKVLHGMLVKMARADCSDLSA
jgi:hypothetical protein